MDDIAGTKYLETLMTQFLSTEGGDYHHDASYEHEIPRHHYEQEADKIAAKLDFGLSYQAGGK